MNITIDDSKIKQAARVLYERDTSYSDDERPSLADYEKAVGRWLEEIAGDIIVDEPDFYAYKHHGHFGSQWENALDWAVNYREPLVAVVRRMTALAPENDAELRQAVSQ